ncbi:Complement C5, partial [Lamellibrachia satsuma]
MVNTAGPTSRVVKILFLVEIDGSSSGRVFTVGHFRPGMSEHSTEIDNEDEEESEEDDFVDDFDLIDEEEELLDVRTEFPESWLMETHVIGASGRGSVPVTFPDSITTWVVQGIGLSPQAGMCVAQPFKVTVFRDFFIQLDLPYSVMLGEQVEVRATLYNYLHRHRLAAYMYLKGTDGICSNAMPGTKSEPKRILVPRNDGYIVSWPIIPLRTGDFKIRVIARTSSGRAIVEKTLHVV